MLGAISEYTVDERTVVLFGYGGATIDPLRTLLGDSELERRRAPLSPLVRRVEV